jgi:hypothetical protein
MGTSIFVSPKDFFKEAVRDAFSKRKIETFPMAEDYLVNILEHYVIAAHLHEEELVDEKGQKKPTTLAETLLIAAQSDHSTKVDMLKKLGDRTLYVCGFFSDSFERKVIDVDYCAEMGGTAYRILAQSTKEDTLCQVYHLYSKKFLAFVEALNYISEKSHLQSSDNVLRIYDRYIKTGSELAREKLSKLGIVPISRVDQKKVSQY